jgi:hypothetical protein
MLCVIIASNKWRSNGSDDPEWTVIEESYLSPPLSCSRRVPLAPLLLTRRLSPEGISSDPVRGHWMRERRAGILSGQKDP